MECEIMEKVDVLNQAAELITEAVELISSVFDDQNTQAYLLDGLNHAACNSGNPYNLSIPQLITQLME